MRTVSKRGEPHKFGVDPSDVATFLASRGLTLDENVLSADCEKRYLTGSDGKLWGHVPSFFGMALARRG